MKIGKVYMMYPIETAERVICDVRNILKPISDEIYYRAVSSEKDHLKILVEELDAIRRSDAICFLGDWENNKVIYTVNQIITSDYFKKPTIEIVEMSDGVKMMVVTK